MGDRKPAPRKQHAPVRKKHEVGLSDRRTASSFGLYHREIGSYLTEILGGEVSTITKGPRRRRPRRIDQWTSHKFSTDPAYSPTVSELEAAGGLLWLAERSSPPSNHKHRSAHQNSFPVNDVELTSSLRTKRPRVSYAELGNEDFENGFAPAPKKPAVTANPPRHPVDDRRKALRGQTTSRVEGIPGQAAVSDAGVGGGGVPGQSGASVAALLNMLSVLQAMPQYNRLAPSALPPSAFAPPRVNLNHPIDQHRQQQQQTSSTGRSQSSLPQQRATQPSPPIAPFMLPTSMPLNPASNPGPDEMPLVLGYLFSGAGSKPPAGISGNRLPPNSLQMPMPKHNQAPVMFLPNFGMLPTGSRPAMKDLKKMFVNESGGRNLQNQVPLTSRPLPSAVGHSSGRSYSGRISQNRNATTTAPHLSGYPFTLPTSRIPNSTPATARITSNPLCMPTSRLPTVSNQRSGNSSGMPGRGPVVTQPNYVGGMDPVVLGSVENGPPLQSNQNSQRNARSSTQQLNASEILSRLSSHLI
ncbi:hypothetical protein BSKO_11044 [Bryopsis sp. KO-2023]|nr:hypothetical protein BSKO_11044 [Bryopsis sp. KO-2023]